MTMYGLLPVFVPGTTRFAVFSGFLFLYAATAKAGELLVDDGSRLVGEILRMQDQIYVIDTDFAGRLEIAASRVRGVSLDREMLIMLSSGDRLSGTLEYSETEGQMLNSKLLGDIPLDEDVRVTGIIEKETAVASTAADSEKVAEMKEEHEKEIEQMKREHAEKVEAMEREQESVAEKWSGNISLGINGASGNTDRLGVNGRAEARRATNGDRLLLYTEGNLQQEDGEATANEVLAGATLERDITRDWFVYGGVDLEKDEFEDLELRALGNLGVGYFLARRDDLTWKALAGFGYQHESFEDGSVDEEGLVSFGYDLSYQYNEWLEFMHKLNYFPSITSPADDYRLVSNLAAQMPIGNTDNWKLQLNLRSQYDSMPRPGIEELDTVYSLNLVYDFE